MPSPGSQPRGVGPVTPHLFVPTARRPLRAKRALYAAETRVVPHSHAWAQLAYSATGVIRLTAELGTYLVPPSRAVWIPPKVEHAITVVESCELRTLYLHQPKGRCGPLVVTSDGDDQRWRHCRVLEVSDLVRALVLALPTRSDAEAPLDADELRRERLVGGLISNELQRAPALPIGVPLPEDKRLRALCEAMLDDPARHASLEAWSQDAGASARTIARLFRSELGTSFGQWRQQALLARAVTLAARGRPIGRIAAELGYASPSAFSAMVRRSFGAPPSRFFASA